MGKGGRICCIAAPWILTLASFICLLLIEIAGWNKNILSSYYFFKADFTDMDLSGASDLANTTTLTQALKLAQDDGTLADTYEIHLWNYCSSDEGSKAGVDFCSPRQGNYYFNPISAWKLDRGSVTSSTSSADNPAESVVNQYKSQLEDHTEELENNLLGDSAHKAMDAYRKASKAMFTMYAIAFWTTLATLGLSILAIFSRWGSFLTWIFSLVSLSHPNQPLISN